MSGQSSIALSRARRLFSGSSLPSTANIGDVFLKSGSSAGFYYALTANTWTGPTSVLTNALVYKGVIDCSANPNYPSATSGDVYVVSVAGKIGGASGLTVEAGDMLLCKIDNAGGTQASVGSSWDVIQTNVVNPLLAANNLSDVALRGAALATLNGFTSTATAAGTTTLTSSSAGIQEFTGATTQTVALPVVSTLIAGWTFFIINNSSGAVTVNSSGGNLVQTLDAGTAAILTCVLITGTSAASWDSEYIATPTVASIGTLISSATAKTTPVDADVIALSDSAASNVLKKLSWANIKATLKTYFDTLYPNGSGTSTGSNTGDQDLSALMPIPLRLGGNGDSTSTSFAHILDQPVTSGHVYSFRIEVPVTADAVGGLKVGVYLDADPAALEAQIEIVNNTAQTLAASKRVTAKANAGDATTYVSVTGATSYFVRMWGTVFEPGGVLLSLAFAQTAATGTTSALKGSTSQMSDLGSA